jgi:hypothetical protein
VGQQIVSYIETTVGRIDFEHAKAFTTTGGEIAFVPIKSFSKILAALFYKQLEDGAEYLFLITFTATEKAVTFTFPSRQMYVMKSSRVAESVNPDFQFQEYDDLSNKVEITANETIDLLCSPVTALFNKPCCVAYHQTGSCYPIRCFLQILFLITPLLFIVPAYSYQNVNLAMISIFFAVYYYGCLLSFILSNA